ncbi:MAG: ATP-binding protein [Pyrobaculum sp.]
MFIDRERELGFLEELYREERAHLVVIYGRRRVGKTWLVRRFLEGKRGVYFHALRQPLEVELERLAEALSKALSKYVKADWDSVAEALAEAGKFVLAVDEFTYWVEEEPGVLASLQQLWDVVSARSPLFLILLSSTASLVEKSLSYGGGLFGRRTAQLRLGPFPPYVVKDLLPYCAEDLAVAYAVTNGIPHYLSLFDPKAPLKRNLERLFSKWGPLYEEAENLLRFEVREPHVYLNIVRAIDEGATTYSEIAQRAHIPAQTLAKYLSVLERLEVVRREAPLWGRARPIYLISDLYIRFWIRAVYRNRELVELGGFVNIDIDRYMQGAYEEIVRRALPRLSERGLVRAAGICGRYWEGDVEIDLACLGDGEFAAFEIKWADLTVDDAERALRTLKKKSGYREGNYYVVARRALGEKTKWLLDLGDIFETSLCKT